MTLDGEQAPDGTPSIVELLGVLPNAEKNILGHVFGQWQITQYALRYAKNHRPVSHEQRGERGLIPVLQRAYDFRIGRMGEAIEIRGRIAVSY